MSPNLSDRLDRIEEEITEEDSSKNTTNNTDPKLDKLSPMDRYILKFNWYVREIMPYYKAEVMQFHNIAADEEYTRRILEGDESIYLPQPNWEFFPTSYKERVAHVLGLGFQGLQQKIKQGEPEQRIADGYGRWRDEDPNRVF